MNHKQHAVAIAPFSLSTAGQLLQPHIAVYDDRLCMTDENQTRWLTLQNHLTAAKLFVIMLI